MSPVALAVGALLCGAAAAAVSIWSVVPAPFRAFALVAVAAGEWSVWLGLLGALGVALGAAALAGVHAGAAGAAPAAGAGAAMGLLAVVLGLLPALQVRALAQANGVPLGWLALPPRVAGAGPDVTVPFATVGGQTLRMDVYRPPAAASSTSAARPALHPAVVVVHGGAWSGGARGEASTWNHWLAAQGYVVVDVDYRVGPPPNWREAIGDVKCAAGTIMRDASRYGIDPGRVALFGRSAGGHLALAAAYGAAERALPASCDVADAAPVVPGQPAPPGAPGVRAVVALYAPADLVRGYEHPANQRVIDGPATLRRFLGGDPAAAAEAYRLASPVTLAGPASPPTLLVHGGRDQFVRPEQTDLLAARLEAAGVAHRELRLPYAQHGFDVLFSGRGAALLRPVLLRFLAAHV